MKIRADVEESGFTGNLFNQGHVLNWLVTSHIFHAMVVLIIASLMSRRECIFISLNMDAFWNWKLSWWRHQMEAFSAFLAICAGNSPVPGEFPAKRPVTRSFNVFFDLRLNKGLSKQSWGWWFETLLRPLWRHCNVGTYWRKDESANEVIMDAAMTSFFTCWMPCHDLS